MPYNLSLMHRLITIIIAYGQSNEKGVGCVARTLLGAGDILSVTENVFLNPMFGGLKLDANANDLGATYITPSGMFHSLAEIISLKYGYDVEINNLAKGNTSPCHDWWGWDSATQALRAEGAAGYDPYGYVAAAKAAVVSAKARGREVWVITAGGQKDIGRLGGANEPTVNDTIEGNRRIQQALIDAGADKTFVGITPKYLYSGTGTNYESFWDKPDGFVHVVQRGLLAALPNSYAGGDLSVLSDTNLFDKDNTQFIHCNHAGNQVGAEIWLKEMEVAGVLQ